MTDTLQSGAESALDLPIFCYAKQVHPGWPEFNKEDEFSDGEGGGEALVKLSEVRAVLARRATAPHAATDESLSEHNARFAIDGAIQYGRENRNQPPSADHWLYEYWNIGRQLATLGATGWDNVTPMPAATHPSEPVGSATITLSGHQLRMALDLINPDGPTDREQLDDELTFGERRHCDDGEKEGFGMCCWNSDTDGVLPLDGEYPWPVLPAVASALVATVKASPSTVDAAMRAYRAKYPGQDGTNFSVFLAGFTENVAAPIPMILHCPKCYTQHIDAPDKRTPDWTNPPHRSHLCHACGNIWRPADVPTEGVRAIQTKGSKDSEPAVGSALVAKIEYVPMAMSASDKAQGWHPNDKTPNDPACQNALDVRGDDRGQGLDPYWKWGFRAGWHDVTESAAAPTDQNQAARDVLAERRRQVEQEGWEPAHDDEYAKGELSIAAACYVLEGGARTAVPPVAWPWAVEWWKPSDERRNLVKAAALILADIERLDRATQQPATQAEGK